MITKVATSKLYTKILLKCFIMIRRQILFNFVMLSKMHSGRHFLLTSKWTSVDVLKVLKDFMTPWDNSWHLGVTKHR